MCTASWLDAGDEFHFLFNRDERRSRAPGLPPRLADSAGVRYLAPVDSTAGGTWIAINEHGFLLALLNRTDDVPGTPLGRVSRGSIIPALIGAPGANSLDASFAALPLPSFSPFRLLLRDGDTREFRSLSWSGTDIERIALDPTTGLVCSSSLGDRRVTLARSAQWQRLHADEDDIDLHSLRRFQRSHEPSPSAESVCMHRSDARTVSQVEVCLGKTSAAMTYTDGPPCRTEPGVTGRLELAR